MSSRSSSPCKYPPESRNAPMLSETPSQESNLKDSTSHRHDGVHTDCILPKSSLIKRKKRRKKTLDFGNEANIMIKKLMMKKTDVEKELIKIKLRDDRIPIVALIRHHPANLHSELHDSQLRLETEKNKDLIQSKPKVVNKKDDCHPQPNLESLVNDCQKSQPKLETGKVVSNQSQPKLDQKKTDSQSNSKVGGGKEIIKVQTKHDNIATTLGSSHAEVRVEKNRPSQSKVQVENECLPRHARLPRSKLEHQGTDTQIQSKLENENEHLPRIKQKQQNEKGSIHSSAPDLNGGEKNGLSQSKAEDEDANLQPNLGLIQIDVCVSLPKLVHLKKGHSESKGNNQSKHLQSCKTTQTPPIDVSLLRPQLEPRNKDNQLQSEIKDKTEENENDQSHSKTEDKLIKKDKESQSQSKAERKKSRDRCPLRTNNELNEKRTNDLSRLIDDEKVKGPKGPQSQPEPKVIKNSQSKLEPGPQVTESGCFQSKLGSKKRDQKPQKTTDCIDDCPDNGEAKLGNEQKDESFQLKLLDRRKDHHQTSLKTGRSKRDQLQSKPDIEIKEPLPSPSMEQKQIQSLSDNPTSKTDEGVRDTRDVNHKTQLPQLHKLNISSKLDHKILKCTPVVRLEKKQISELVSEKDLQPHPSSASEKPVAAVDQSANVVVVDSDKGDCAKKLVGEIRNPSLHSKKSTHRPNMNASGRKSPRILINKNIDVVLPKDSLVDNSNSTLKPLEGASAGENRTKSSQSSITTCINIKQGSRVAVNKKVILPRDDQSLIKVPAVETAEKTTKILEKTIEKLPTNSLERNSKRTTLVDHGSKNDRKCTEISAGRQEGHAVTSSKEAKLITIQSLSENVTKPHVKSVEKSVRLSRKVAHEKSIKSLEENGVNHEESDNTAEKISTKLISNNQVVEKVLDQPNNVANMVSTDCKLSELSQEIPTKKLGRKPKVGLGNKREEMTPEQKSGNEVIQGHGQNLSNGLENPVKTTLSTSNDLADGKRTETTGHCKKNLSLHREKEKIKAATESVGESADSNSNKSAKTGKKVLEGLVSIESDVSQTSRRRGINKQEKHDGESKKSFPNEKESFQKQVETPSVRKAKLLQSLFEKNLRPQRTVAIENNQEVIDSSKTNVSEELVVSPTVVEKLSDAVDENSASSISTCETDPKTPLVVQKLLENRIISAETKGLDDQSHEKSTSKLRKRMNVCTTIETKRTEFSTTTSIKEVGVAEIPRLDKFDKTFVDVNQTDVSKRFTRKSSNKGVKNAEISQESKVTGSRNSELENIANSMNVSKSVESSDQTAGKDVKSSGKTTKENVDNESVMEESTNIPKISNNEVVNVFDKSTQPSVTDCNKPFSDDLNLRKRRPRKTLVDESMKQSESLLRVAQTDESHSSSQLRNSGSGRETINSDIGDTYHQRPKRRVIRKSSDCCCTDHSSDIASVNVEDVGKPNENEVVDSKQMGSRSNSPIKVGKRLRRSSARGDYAESLNKKEKCQVENSTEVDKSDTATSEVHLSHGRRGRKKSLSSSHLRRSISEASLCPLSSDVASSTQHKLTRPATYKKRTKSIADLSVQDDPSKASQNEKLSTRHSEHRSNHQTERKRSKSTSRIRKTTEIDGDLARSTPDLSTKASNEAESVDAQKSKRRVQNRAKTHIIELRKMTRNLSKVDLQTGSQKDCEVVSPDSIVDTTTEVTILPKTKMMPRHRVTGKFQKRRIPDIQDQSKDIEDSTGVGLKNSDIPSRRVIRKRSKSESESNITVTKTSLRSVNKHQHQVDLELNNADNDFGASEKLPPLERTKLRRSKSRPELQTITKPPSLQKQEEKIDPETTKTRESRKVENDGGQKIPPVKLTARRSRSTTRKSDRNNSDESSSHQKYKSRSVSRLQNKANDRVSLIPNEERSRRKPVEDFPAVNSTTRISSRNRDRSRSQRGKSSDDALECANNTDATGKEVTRESFRAHLKRTVRKLSLDVGGERDLYDSTQADTELLNDQGSSRTIVHKDVCESEMILSSGDCKALDQTTNIGVGVKRPRGRPRKIIEPVNEIKRAKVDIRPNDIETVDNVAVDSCIDDQSKPNDKLVVTNDKRRFEIEYDKASHEDSVHRGIVTSESIVAKKSRGRPRKSVERPSESEVLNPDMVSDGEKKLDDNTVESSIGDQSTITSDLQQCQSEDTSDGVLVHEEDSNAPNAVSTKKARGRPKRRVRSLSLSTKINESKTLENKVTVASRADNLLEQNDLQPAASHVEHSTDEHSETLTGDTVHEEKLITSNRTSPRVSRRSLVKRDKQSKKPDRSVDRRKKSSSEDEITNSDCLTSFLAFLDGQSNENMRTSMSDDGGSPEKNRPDSAPTFDEDVHADQVSELNTIQNVDPADTALEVSNLDSDKIPKKKKQNIAADIVVASKVSNDIPVRSSRRIAQRIAQKKTVVESSDSIEETLVHTGNPILTPEDVEVQQSLAASVQDQVEKSSGVTNTPSDEVLESIEPICGVPSDTPVEVMDHPMEVQDELSCVEEEVEKQDDNIPSVLDEILKDYTEANNVESTANSSSREITSAESIEDDTQEQTIPDPIYKLPTEAVPDEDMDPVSSVQFNDCVQLPIVTSNNMVFGNFLIESTDRTPIVTPEHVPEHLNPHSLPTEVDMISEMIPSALCDDSSPVRPSIESDAGVDSCAVTENLSAEADKVVDDIPSMVMEAPTEPKNDTVQDQLVESDLRHVDQESVKDTHHTSPTENLIPDVVDSNFLTPEGDVDQVASEEKEKFAEPSAVHAEPQALPWHKDILDHSNEKFAENLESAVESHAQELTAPIEARAQSTHPENLSETDKNSSYDSCVENASEENYHDSLSEDVDSDENLADKLNRLNKLQAAPLNSFDSPDSGVQDTMEEQPRPITDGEIKMVLTKNTGSKNSHVVKEIKITPKSADGSRSSRSLSYSPIRSELTIKRRSGRGRKYPIFTESELIAKQLAAASSATSCAPSFPATPTVFNAEAILSKPLDKDDLFPGPQEPMVAQPDIVLDDQLNVTLTKIPAPVREPAQPILEGLAQRISESAESDNSLSPGKRSRRPSTRSSLCDDELLQQQIKEQDVATIVKCTRRLSRRFSMSDDDQPKLNQVTAPVSKRPRRSSLRACLDENVPPQLQQQTPIVDKPSRRLSTKSSTCENERPKGQEGAPAVVKRSRRLSARLSQDGTACTQPHQETTKVNACPELESSRHSIVQDRQPQLEQEASKVDERPRRMSTRTSICEDELLQHQREIGISEHPVCEINNSQQMEIQSCTVEEFLESELAETSVCEVEQVLQPEKAVMNELLDQVVREEKRRRESENENATLTVEEQAAIHEDKRPRLESDHLDQQLEHVPPQVPENDPDESPSSLLAKYNITRELVVPLTRVSESCADAIDTDESHEISTSSLESNNNTMDKELESNGTVEVPQQQPPVVRQHREVATTTEPMLPEAMSSIVLAAAANAGIDSAATNILLNSMDAQSLAPMPHNMLQQHQFYVVYIPDNAAEGPSATLLNFQPVPDEMMNKPGVSFSLAPANVTSTSTITNAPNVVTPTKMVNGNASTSTASTNTNDELNKSFVCSSCAEVSDLVGRLEASHGMTEEDKNIECPYCSNHFQSLVYLEYHVRQEHVKCQNEAQCRHSGLNSLRIPNHEAAPEFEMYITFALKCRSCYDIFPTVSLLNDHVMRKHSNLVRRSPAAMAAAAAAGITSPFMYPPLQNGARSVLQCPSDCICRVGIRGNLTPLQRQQMIRRCPNAMRRLEKVEAAAYEVYTCNLCKSTFLMKDEVIEHLMKMHDVPCKFPCYKCLVSFRSPQLQESHRCSETTLRELDKLFYIAILPSNVSGKDETSPTATATATATVTKPLPVIKNISPVVIPIKPNEQQSPATRYNVAKRRLSIENEDELNLLNKKFKYHEKPNPNKPDGRKMRQRNCGKMKCSKRFFYLKSLQDHYVSDHIVAKIGHVEPLRKKAAELLKMLRTGSSLTETSNSRTCQCRDGHNLRTRPRQIEVPPLDYPLQDQHQKKTLRQIRQVHQSPPSQIQQLPSTPQKSSSEIEVLNESPSSSRPPTFQPRRRRRERLMEPYACNRCPKSFLSGADLTAHRLEVHKLGHYATRPYVCELCHTKYFREERLKKHRLHKHEGVVFDTPIKSLFDNNIEDSSSQDNSMNLSAQSTTEPELTTTTSATATLDDSSKEANDSLNVTVNSTDGENNSSTCVRRDSSDSSNGPKDPEPQALCSLCAEVCSSKVSLKNHMKREHGCRASICQFCNNLLIETSEVRHMLDHHIVHSKGEKAGSRVSSSLTNSINSTLNSLNTEVSDTRREVDELVRTLGLHRLQSLMIYHDFEGKCNNAIMRCPICPEMFATRESCRFHYIWAHDDTCIVCDEGFRNGSIACHHKVTAHTSTASYLWCTQRLVTAIVEGLRLNPNQPSPLLYQELLARLGQHEHSPMLLVGRGASMVNASVSVNPSPMIGSENTAKKTVVNEQAVNAVTPPPFLEEVVLSEDQLPDSGNIIEVVIGKDDSEDDLLSMLNLSPSYQSREQSSYNSIPNAGVGPPDEYDDDDTNTSSAPCTGDVNTAQASAPADDKSATSANSSLDMPNLDPAASPRPSVETTLPPAPTTPTHQQMVQVMPASTPPSAVAPAGATLSPGESYVCSGVCRYKLDNGEEQLVLVVTDDDLVTYRNDIGSLATRISATCDSLTLDEITEMLKAYFEGVGMGATANSQ
ncbi:hypothetical protein QAD02_012073 [Eretmocerus hayati]|uniref:Uncharacterized protein n=1 Tax=Eretmocerus hayati TaxID=131215 RepID=A0ACC2P0C6_9HYME|nr:hypothetical protein QAD02_012073 [Eretmocerus hayati]